MFKLAHVPPEQASGRIREVYSRFPETIGPPKPLQLMTASPDFFRAQSRIVEYFGSHPTLNFSLLTAIRLVAAHTYDYPYCRELNRKILLSMGAEAGPGINALLESLPLEVHEREMLKFVTGAIENPEAVTQDDIQALRRLGWSDADILDALAHGAFMQGHSVLMAAFSCSD